jgi:large subunit ribosomal protein L29
MGANKKMQMKDIAAIDDKDLMATVENNKVELARTQYSHTVSSSENPMNIRTKRRDIARMLTYHNSKKNETK